MDVESFRAKLTKVEDVGKDIRIFRFEPSEGGSIPFSFQAGQFVQLDISCGKDPTIRRAYSIANAPSETSHLEFIIRILPDGTCTKVLKSAEVGFEVDILGPFGKFILQESDAPKTFVAGGTGIGPVMSMVRELDAEKNNAQKTLIYGVQKHENRAYREELQKWAQQETHTYIPVVAEEDPVDEGEKKGLVTEVLDSLPNDVDFDSYVCGPPAMVKAVEEALEAKKTGRIFKEAYG